LDCIREDIVAAKSFAANNLQNNLEALKLHIYSTYIKDTTTFIAATAGTSNTTGFGILDQLNSGTYSIPGNYVDSGNFLTSNSKYYISTSNTKPNSTSTQLYNLSMDTDLTSLKVSFKNSFANNTSGTPIYFYYYYVDPLNQIPQTWQFILDNETKNYVQNLVEPSFLLANQFISQADYNNILFTPSLDKDIPEFEIDFNTSKNLGSPIIDGIVDIKLIEYPPVGYYLGYRPDLSKDTDQFLKSTTFDTIEKNIIADKFFDTAGETYMFIKLNNWGYTNFFGQKMIAKVLLTASLGNPKLDSFVHEGYRFRQPVNISRLDFELVDYLGNTLDINGFDISYSIKMMQIISADQKDTMEQQSIFFNY
jgi:hypothetical protein